MNKLGGDEYAVYNLSITKELIHHYGKVPAGYMIGCTLYGEDIKKIKEDGYYRYILGHGDYVDIPIADIEATKFTWKMTVSEEKLI